MMGSDIGRVLKHVSDFRGLGGGRLCAYGHLLHFVILFLNFVIGCAKFRVY